MIRLAVIILVVGVFWLIDFYGDKRSERKTRSAKSLGDRN